MTVAPPPVPPAKPQRPWPLRWYMWVVYGIVGLCMIGAIGATLAPPETPNTTEKNNDAVEAIDDLDPADNSEDNEDAFTTETHEGTGDNIIDLPDGATSGFITATHDGSANFIVSPLDENNERTFGMSMVNAIGSYEGATAFGLHSLGNDPTQLEITADGAWEITIAPLSEAPALELPASGTGDAVYRYEGGSAKWHLTHEGSSNYIVDSTASVMSLVNEIGSYEGTVAVVDEPAVITILADGAWSITAA